MGPHASREEALARIARLPRPLVMTNGVFDILHRGHVAYLEAARDYVEETHADVQIVPVACLHICKNGPIAATYPTIKFKKRVKAKRARKLVDKLAS